MLLKQMEKLTVKVLSDRVYDHRQTFRHPIYCVLQKKNIHTIGQMIELSDAELMSIRNFGQAAMQKVQEFRALVKEIETFLALHEKYSHFS